MVATSMENPMRNVTLLFVLLTSPMAAAQEANPISTTLKGTFERISKLILAAADEMPATEYAFKPTPEVRSFGQLVGHVADASYMFCSSAKKEKLAPKNVEKGVTGKDALKKALTDAFAYCDAVYAASTDAKLTEPVELPFMKTTRFGALDINVAHDNEHYGNIVTYLRLKKLVPPSSKGRE
jgi:uncharacterized damage-inducible protein DinB